MSVLSALVCSYLGGHNKTVVSALFVRQLAKAAQGPRPVVLASGPPVRQLPALLLPLLLPLLLLPRTAPALWTDASGVGSMTRPAAGVSASSRRRGEELCCVPAGTRRGRRLRHGRWPVPNLYMTLHGTLLPPGRGRSSRQLVILVKRRRFPPRRPSSTRLPPHLSEVP